MELASIGVTPTYLPRHLNIPKKEGLSSFRGFGDRLTFSLSGSGGRLALGRLGGRFGDRLGAWLSVRKAESRKTSLVLHCYSAAAFDPLTPFFPHRPDEGGRGYLRGYLPTLGQPAWGGGHPYLPTQNAGHPPYPTTQKSQIQACEVAEV